MSPGENRFKQHKHKQLTRKHPHLIVFDHTADLQLLDAVTHRDQFGYTYTETHLINNSQENFITCQFEQDINPLQGFQIVKFHLVFSRKMVS